MKTAGIICEYNPFHAGHQYLIEQARRAGAECVVCLMSGNFTQRGEVALLPPVPRAAMAVAGGADVVVELPFPFAAAAAPFFAAAGVRILSYMGCDTLVFGSETGDLKALCAMEERLPKHPAKDKEMGVAAAHFGDAAPASNDILALSYLRAIREFDLPLSLHPVLRRGSGYLDTELTQGAFPSARALREQLNKEDIAAHLPECVRPLWLGAREEYPKTGEISRLGTALLATLRVAGGVPDTVADCGGGLGARLAHCAMSATDYEELCAMAATKRYTAGRIRRALLYLLSGVRYEDLRAEPAYVRLLALNKKGREYLRCTQKTRLIPVVTKPCDIVGVGPHAARQRELARVADGLYAICLAGGVTPAALQTAKPYLAPSS